MEAVTNPTISLRNLHYLPKFAAYLLHDNLDAFIQAQYRYAFELDLPLLKYFLNMPEEERMAISRQTTSELLTYLAQNKAEQQIEQSMKQWMNNQLPVIERNEIVAEDITLVSHTRKMAMLDFVPTFTDDALQIIELVKEIDLFVVNSITAATNLFLGMFKHRIEENSHFIQKVAETVPGAVYVYDLNASKGIYANNKLPDIIGYQQGDLNSMGENVISSLIHPDDQEALRQQMQQIRECKNDGSIVSKYRIRTKDGTYKWLANYESVFRRNEDGSVAQTIGITLDVNEEQRTVNQLHERERQLLEAQEIAQLGDYYWDFAGKASTASPKAVELIEVMPNDYEAFMSRVHPDDRTKVTAAIDESLISGYYNCEYRMVGQNSVRNIWARGLVEYKEGKAIGIRGTLMDVTQHNQLLEKLAEADARHKQSEALAQIGTFAWTFSNETIEWSDEMYSIHEIDRNTKLSLDSILQNVHPEDQGLLRQTIENSIANGEAFDFYYRVLLQGGREKILHSRGRIEFNHNDKPERLVGTDQDVTEKQTLIRRLQKSESLYKQAEKIAEMGNWSWDVRNNKLEWTDQLYLIYGLDPQSEEITIERFLSFVHPDDREFVANGVEKLNTEDSLDYTFRIVTEDGSEKWLRSIAQVLRNDKGDITHVIGTEQNVTEKQKLIGKLEESQRLYKQAQELSQMGNFSWNCQTDEVFWSDEVYNIYEKPLGSRIKFTDAFVPIIEEHKATVQASIEEVLATKKGKSVSYAVRKKEGGLKYINLHTDVVLAKDGTVTSIIGTAQDITEREELIHRLQESEQLYKQAQSLAHMGSWAYDIVNEKISWSEELYAIYELPKTSPLSIEQWSTYLDAKERDAMFAQMTESIEQKKPLDVVHRISLPNGKKKILHRRGEVVCDQGGKPIKIIGTTQDVTEQYKIQAELRESQTFIRKITDATPSIIASYNVNTGAYTFISEGLEKLLGYQTNEVMQKGTAFFIDIVHPNDLAAMMEKNQRTLDEANDNPQRKDIVVEFTYRMRHKNGAYRWFHTYGTIFDYSAEGKVEHVLNITLDVTEQKEAMETIREQEYFIQQIADASPTILYLFDVTAQSIAYINREAFFVLGYLPEEIMEEGSNITEVLYHPDDVQLLPARKQSRKNFQQVDSMIQYECRMRHKDGEYRWLLVREIVFKSDEKGAITQIIGAALDITRRKDMERTILQNAHQLEQSNASLEEFAYVASHDLKEPLRKISTFGDRLVASQRDRLTDDGKIYLNKIVDASQRMQNMISDLLSISMISGNRQFEKVSLQKILEETLQTLEYKIEQQKAVIRYESLPEANVIPSQFRQLFQNLVSNSLKFVREDVQPVISIDCSIVPEEETRPYQLAKAESYLKIVFTDNGIGFEHEHAQKIFAIFHRLHGRSEYEGSGIGLAICKKIAEHHGGVIFATGKPGSGASFTLIIPA